jgi:hypothetical protein
MAERENGGRVEGCEACVTAPDRYALVDEREMAVWARSDEAQLGGQLSNHREQQKYS